MQVKLVALREAIGQDDERLVKQLMDRKELAGGRDVRGATALHLAVLHRHLHLASYLCLIHQDAVDHLDQVSSRACATTYIIYHMYYITFLLCYTVSSYGCENHDNIGQVCTRILYLHCTCR